MRLKILKRAHDQMFWNRRNSFIFFYFVRKQNNSHDRNFSPAHDDFRILIKSVFSGFAFSNIKRIYFNMEIAARLCTGFVWLRTVQVAGTCGHATESSDLTKDLQFLSSLMSVKRCRKEDFAACSTELIRHFCSHRQQSVLVCCRPRPPTILRTYPIF